MTSKKHGEQLPRVLSTYIIPFGVLKRSVSFSRNIKNKIPNEHTGTCSNPIWTNSALILMALSNMSRIQVRISTESEPARRTRTWNNSREFQVWFWTFAASALIVGLAIVTSSTVTILRPGRATKLKVSAGSESKASRRRSWYKGLFHVSQNPVTAWGSTSRGALRRIEIRSFNVAVSTPWRSGQSNDLTTPGQLSLTCCRKIFNQVMDEIWYHLQNSPMCESKLPHHTMEYPQQQAFLGLRLFR